VPAAARLKLISTAWPPFTDEAGKQRVALDLVHAALERAGYQESTAILSPAAWAEQLRSGNCDGSAATWYTPEREGYLLYSDAYLENRLVLVGLKGSSVSAKGFADLAGKKIGLVEGYAYGEEVEKAREPKFVRGAGSQQNLRALLKGELDYVLEDQLLVHYLFEQEPVKAKEHFVVGSQVLVKRSLHFTVRKDRKDARQIIERFNAQIAQMLRDGTYNRALQVNWIQTDVDHDGKSELVIAGNYAGMAPPERSYQPIATSSDPALPPDQRHRFFIDGHVYDSWDAIPEQYKHHPKPEDVPPATSVKFNVFTF
jgi:ABC-type amino acid transport substrate-binding protein